MSDKISGSMQENLLTLLAWDDRAAGIIKGAVEEELFESVIHRDIVHRCIEYHNTYKKAPGEHLPDLLEDILDGDDKKASLYERLLENVYSLKEDINTEYVLKSLYKFVRQQQLKISVVESAKHIKAGDIDSAELELSKGLKKTLDVFEPGITFKNDVISSLQYVNEDSDRILLGIPYLDTIRVGPAPGELFLVVGGANKGKSWSLLHIAVQAAMQGKKVQVITLEMSEKKYMARFAQSIFSIGKREAEVEITRILSENNNFEGFTFNKLKRPVLSDPDIINIVSAKLKRLSSRLNISVKNFPTGKLTMKGLETFLDQRERWDNYTPDIIVLDYADLMRLDENNLRIATGGVYKDLRGLTEERCLSLATASQTNRTAEDTPLVTMKHLAEDYSKAFTADIILTYNRTEREKALNLARLHVAKNRDEEAGGTVLISQQYKIGKFFLSGSFMSNDYWSELENTFNSRQN